MATRDCRDKPVGDPCEARAYHGFNGLDDEVTQPAGVAPFIAWSAGRARAAWLSGGNSSAAKIADP
jgi:hypothetical protein